MFFCGQNFIFTLLWTFGRFDIFFGLEYAFKSVGSLRNGIIFCGMYFSHRTWFLTKVVGCAHTMRHLYSRKTSAFLWSKLHFFDFCGLLVVLLDRLVWNMRIKVSVRLGMF